MSPRGVPTCLKGTPMAAGAVLGGSGRPAKKMFDSGPELG
jgi:hypothetical protein